jgi:hypothetical protein
MKAWVGAVLLLWAVGVVDAGCSSSGSTPGDAGRDAARSGGHTGTGSGSGSRTGSASGTGSESSHSRSESRSSGSASFSGSGSGPGDGGAACTGLCTGGVAPVGCSATEVCLPAAADSGTICVAGGALGAQCSFVQPAGSEPAPCFNTCQTPLTCLSTSIASHAVGVCVEPNGAPGAPCNADWVGCIAGGCVLPPGGGLGTCPADGGS